MNNTTLQVIDERQLGVLARQLHFVPKIYADRFADIVLQSYVSYVQSNHYFLDDCDDIPAALHILNNDIDVYRDNSSIFELMVDCIAESLHNENPNRYPEPFGDHWMDEHELVCREIVAQGWDGFQSVMIHDMEAVFSVFNVSFRIPEQQRVVNHPIVEVW